MSKSGFAFSAAYSTVPVRGVWMQRDVDACTWSNYNDHCLMRACPGQVCRSFVNPCHQFDRQRGGRLCCFCNLHGLQCSSLVQAKSISARTRRVSHLLVPSWFVDVRICSASTMTTMINSPRWLADP